MWGQGALQCHGEACVCARRWPAVHACHSTGSGQLRDTVLKEFQVSNIYHASVEVSFIVFQFSMFFVSLYCQVIMLFSVLCSGNSPALSVYPQLDREVMSWPGRCASEPHELGHVFQSLCSSSWAPLRGCGAGSYWQQAECWRLGFCCCSWTCEHQWLRFHDLGTSCLDSPMSRR